MNKTQYGKQNQSISRKNGYTCDKSHA